MRPFGGRLETTNLASNAGLRFILNRGLLSISKYRTRNERLLVDAPVFTVRTLQYSTLSSTIRNIRQYARIALAVKFLKYYQRFECDPLKSEV